MMTLAFEGQLPIRRKGTHSQSHVYSQWKIPVRDDCIHPTPCFILFLTSLAAWSFIQQEQAISFVVLPGQKMLQKSPTMAPVVAQLKQIHPGK